ncbi:GDP-mannose:cellobiosyl-diphosphopolyprenol alpha-mannosyltransferase [compost metagenome]
MQNQLHVVESAATTSGGEGLAALRYAQSIAAAGCNVTLLSKQLPAAIDATVVSGSSFSQQRVISRRTSIGGLWQQYQQVREIITLQNIDILHIHGMWSPFLAVAAYAARKKKVPVVISPHGCLEPWALQYKRSKKLLALITYQGMVLRQARAFIATARQELESIRKLNLRQPIAILPNGVDAEEFVARGAGGAVKTILFLSRVHPIKGLLDLVEAWSRVRAPGWRIVIAGGDEDGYRAKVEALIAEKGLQSDFEFLGFVSGPSKQACFNAADIFVLPTYSENFGIVIAEALANELPVITTTGAPWQDLVTHECGWWVTPGVDGVTSALSEAMNLSAQELRLMGQRGRYLVLNKYSWSTIGASARAVSNWLLDSSLPKPAELVEDGK